MELPKRNSAVYTEQVLLRIRPETKKMKLELDRLGFNSSEIIRRATEKALKEAFEKAQAIAS